TELFTGSGKSTFLRHLRRLLIVDESSDQIPIFFELKYFKDDGFEFQISEWLNHCRLDVEVHFIIKLLEQGRLTIFLDAFDELPSDLMDICERRIVELCQKYSSTNIIVTTRPNLQISQNSLGNHFKMTDLNRNQTTEILKKVCNTQAEALRAAHTIFSSDFVSGAIKTPILAVLIALTYKRWQSIPDTMSEFYNRVFVTLLSIHDNTKSGKRIRREIDTKLGDTQILSVVNQLSYYLTIEEKYSFSKLDFENVCMKSLAKKSFEPSEHKAVFSCLISACNILIKDGFDEYKYIHRSFQEFYSAKHIESLHHSKKKIFYSKCLREKNFRLSMAKILEFLFEIDEMYMFEYLIIPYLVQHECIIPYSDTDIDILRDINLTHLLEVIIESKSAAGNGNMIETNYTNLFIYVLLFGEDFIDEVSEKIDDELRKNDFSAIREKLHPSHIWHNLYDMYPVQKIIELFYEGNSFISKISSVLESELSDAENTLDSKLDEVFEKTDEQENDDVSDL
ncbi:NACHT domain-containing protein, partial [Aeromonas salmonicida]|uniref:NACHT domain-containing protein n=3 Tax=Aeromonas salmonicida TaxID=645 RepID=UPI00111A051C